MKTVRSLIACQGVSSRKISEGGLTKNQISLSSGMGEGIVDSRLTRHKFWLTIEPMSENGVEPNNENRQTAPNDNNRNYQVPSLLSTHLANSLNYPANIYFIEKWDDNTKLDLSTKMHLIKSTLPCDLHLVNLRTLTEPELPLFPSQSALMVFQRFGYDCQLAAASASDFTTEQACAKHTNIPNELFSDVYITAVDSVSLTGLKQLGHVQNLADIRIEPMELKTFNVTFA